MLNQRRSFGPNSVENYLNLGTAKKGEYIYSNDKKSFLFKHDEKTSRCSNDVAPTILENKQQKINPLMSGMKSAVYHYRK
jgi:hypothetical protein